MYSEQVIFGHHKPLMGLAVHPDDEMFATAGHDKNIALWKGHKLIFATQVLYNLFVAHCPFVSLFYDINYFFEVVVT